MHHRQRSFARWQQRLRKHVDRSGSRVSEDPSSELAYRQWSESVWAEVAGLAIDLRSLSDSDRARLHRVLDEPGDSPAPASPKTVVEIQGGRIGLGSAPRQ